MRAHITRLNNWLRKALEDFPSSGHMEFERTIQIVSSASIILGMDFLGSIWESGEVIRTPVITTLKWIGWSFSFSILAVPVRLQYIATNYDYDDRKKLDLAANVLKFTWLSFLIISVLIWYTAAGMFLEKLSEFAGEGSVHKSAFNLLDNAERLLTVFG